MPQNIDIKLYISIADAASHLVDYQEFLKMAMSELSNPGDKTLDRVTLLLDAYLSYSEEDLDELKDCIHKLRTKALSE